MKTCWPKFVFYLVVLSLGLGQMLTACGQNGSLYLPKPEKIEPATSQPAATPAKAAASEEPEASKATTTTQP